MEMRRQRERFWLYSSRKDSEVKSTLRMERSSKQNLEKGVSKESRRDSMSRGSYWRVVRVRMKLDVIYHANLNMTSLLFFA